MKIKKFGIEITKPWSKEMYDHNDKVLKQVKKLLEEKWRKAYSLAENSYYVNASDDDYEFEDAEWGYSNSIMADIQEAILGYGFGDGYTIYDVEKAVFQELEVLPYWRAKEVCEDLCIPQKDGFIGLG